MSKAAKPNDLKEPEITGDDFRAAVKAVVEAANAVKDKPSDNILVKGNIALAQLLQVSHMTIHRWRKSGKIVEQARIGKILYYDLKKVKASLNISINE